MTDIFIAQVRKDLREIMRDGFTLTLALVFPLLLMLLFGASVSFEPGSLPIAVIDQDNTPFSRAYADAFRQSLRFRLKTYHGPVGVDDLLRTGEARAVLLIPRKFAQDFNRLREGHVQLAVDAVDANTAKLLSADAIRITSGFLDRERREREPMSIRVFHNPGLSSRHYIVPGALAFCLALFPPLLAALGVAREFEHRTILQAHAAGLSAIPVVAAKVIAYSLLALGEWCLCILVACPLFALWPRGDVVYFLLLTPLYLASSTALGVMIGMMVKNATAAVQGVQFTGFVVSLVMAGLIFPVQNIPAALRWVAYLVPARYYIELGRAVFLKPGGLPAIWHIPCALAALCLSFCIIAAAAHTVEGLRDVA